MNLNIVNMFSRRKPKHNVSIERHLWTVIQKLSEFKQSSSAYVPLDKPGDITITFAPVGERARKVVRRSNYRMTGKLPSQKNQRTIQWESHYEKEVFQLLEIAPFVVSYREQPALFEYRDTSGEINKHYPDIYVELINGIRLFIEVKPDSAKDNQDLLNRESILKQLLSNKGYKYIQIYPNQIKGLKYQENAQHMLWHINLEVPFPVKEKIKAFLSTEKSVTLEKLIKFVDDSNAKSWIYSLLAEGVIQCDLSMQLSGTTLLSVKGGN